MQYLSTGRLEVLMEGKVIAVVRYRMPVYKEVRGVWAKRSVIAVVRYRMPV